MRFALFALALSGVSLAQSPSVKLTWKSNPGNPAAGIAYYPYRAAGECGTPNQEFRKLTATPVAELAYTDTSVRAGRKYCYFVTATDGQHESAPSATANAVIPVQESR